MLCAIIILMPKVAKKILASFALATLFASITPIQNSNAVVSACTANITPNQVNSGSTNNLSLTVINTSGQTINWVRITRPNSNFTLGGVIATGWTNVATADYFTLTGRTINPGASRTFTLTSVVAASLDQPSANWSVLTADDGSGASSTSCTGTLGTQIGNPDVTAPIISGITVSNTTSSGATISWTTNELSDSKVNFGTSISYGQNVSSSGLTTSHSLNLTGLSANTGYHFQVQSKDPSNNTASSSDNTFLTQGISSTPTATTTMTTEKPSISTDSTLPTVSLTTNFTQVYKETPTIFGSASDNVAIQKIEYSTDAGENWLPVDKSSGLNTKQAGFEFKPASLPDGNYEILVRAFDTSNNEGRGANSVLIIDKLPPVIGANVVSYGSQAALVQNNQIYSVIGVDQRITLATIGGPTSVVIKAVSKDERTKVFSLTKEAGSNLWSGVLAFEEPGEYTLSATAKDGAGNTVFRELNKVFVNKPSQVGNAEGKGLAGAKIEVNYFDAESSSRYLWDALAFGQNNPQTTNTKGEFNFFLPAGKYFLRVEAEGYYSENSEIFVLEEGLPLAANIKLEKSFGLSIANFKLVFPRISLEDFQVDLGNKTLASDQISTLVNKKLPVLNLANSQQGSLKAIDLSGKQTLLSFVATWSPRSEEQIAQLEKLAKDKNQNILLITTLESREKVLSYKKIGSYDIEFLVDPIGETLSKFNILTIPYHLIVGKDLQVKEAKTGVFSKEELQEALDKH